MLMGPMEVPGGDWAMQWASTRRARHSALSGPRPEHGRATPSSPTRCRADRSRAGRCTRSAPTTSRCWSTGRPSPPRCSPPTRWARCRRIVHHDKGSDRVVTEGGGDLPLSRRNASRGRPAAATTTRWRTISAGCSLPPARSSTAITIARAQVRAAAGARKAWPAGAASSGPSPRSKATSPATASSAATRFTMADVYVGSQVDWGLTFGSIPPAEAFVAYAERIQARRAYKAAKAVDNALIAGDAQMTPQEHQFACGTRARPRRPRISMPRPSPTPASATSTARRATIPMAMQGDVLVVEFTVMGIPCIGLNGGPQFTHSEAFSFQVADRGPGRDRPLLERHRRQWRRGKPVRLVQGPVGHFLADHPARADRGRWRARRRGSAGARLRGDDDDAQDRRRGHRGGDREGC